MEGRRKKQERGKDRIIKQKIGESERKKTKREWGIDHWEEKPIINE